jgi:hypothetical protein
MTSKEQDVAAAIERVETACTGDIAGIGATGATGATGEIGGIGDTAGTGSVGGADGPDAPRDADGDGWAHRVAFTMLLEDVAESRVVEALDEVAAQVAASGEGPRELFGDPDSWVAERRALWRETGTEHVARPRPSLLDLLGESLLTTAILSGLILVYMLITWSWGEPLSLGVLLFPVAVGIITRAVQIVYTGVRAARSQSMGVLAAAGTTVVGVAVTLGIITLTRDTMLVGPAALWLLGLAVVCAGLGMALAMATAGRTARPAAVPQDEEEWFHALARALRGREDMTDARVKEIVAESRAHAREAGAAPQEEFGSPWAYADRFAGNPRLAGRRKAWFFTALAILVLVYVVASVADGTASVWGFAWLLFAGLLAVSEWRAVRRA